MITTVWADTITGTDGDDFIQGTEEDDVLKGRDGNDQVAGNAGNDRIEGGDGDDFLFGSEGDDDLSGGDGNDRLAGDFGGSGNDRLSGGDGNDLLVGYAGADNFVCGNGIDVVIDYNEDEGDIKSSDCEDVGLITIEKVQAGSAQPHDAGDFFAEVIGDNPGVPSVVSLGTDPEFRTIGVLPGSYSVHEIGESSGVLTFTSGDPDIVYDVEYSQECSGTIEAGETRLCTVTNTFVD